MDINNADALLQNRITPTMERARCFYEGDHWQNGDGLIIKKPKGDTEILRQMKEGFASQNKVAEVVDRRRDGNLGRDPLWKLIPKTQEELTEAQQRLVDEMTAAIVEWWNEKGLLEVQKSAAVGCDLERRSEIRPFVARGFKDETGKITTVANLAAALDLLHFETVNPKTAGVFLEEQTLKPYSIYKTERKENTEIEFSFVDADGVTHFNIFTEDQYSKFAKDVLPTLAKYITTPTGTKTVGETKIDLGGKLFLYEMDYGKSLISDSFQSMQRQLNLNLTMQGRNSYTAGFRERHFLNADEPDELNLGAGSATYHQGVPVRNDQQEVIGIGTPSITVIDPVEPTTFIDSENSLDRQMLAEVDQRHVGMSDDATASGNSRVEARGEFKNSLINNKGPIDSMGRYVIEFAMMFAAAMTNRTSEFEQFRCDFNSIVNAGTPSPEEKDDNRKAYVAGEISLETLRSRNGVEDTDAEDSKVKSEDGYEINQLDKILDVLLKANGKLPLKMQVEFLVNSLGQNEGWTVDSIMSQLAKEDAIIAQSVEVGSGATN